MKIRNLCRATLLGALALPFVAIAQAADNSPAADPNSPTMPSDSTAPKSDQTDMKKDAVPSGDTTGKMDTAAPTDTTATKEITGTISKISHNQVWLNAQDGTTLTLNTDHMTKVYKPTGSTEKMNMLKEGQQIRASYDMKADKPHALRIDVMPTDVK